VVTVIISQLSASPWTGPR